VLFRSPCSDRLPMTQPHWRAACLGHTAASATRSPHASASATPAQPPRFDATLDLAMHISTAAAGGAVSRVWGEDVATAAELGGGTARSNRGRDAIASLDVGTIPAPVQDDVHLKYPIVDPDIMVYMPTGLGALDQEVFTTAWRAARAAQRRRQRDADHAAEDADEPGAAATAPLVRGGDGSAAPQLAMPDLPCYPSLVSSSGGHAPPSRRRRRCAARAAASGTTTAAAAASASGSRGHRQQHQRGTKRRRSPSPSPSSLSPAVAAAASSSASSCAALQSPDACALGGGVAEAVEDAGADSSSSTDARSSDDDHGGDVDEIGRASCRERV